MSNWKKAISSIRNRKKRRLDDSIPEEDSLNDNVQQQLSPIEPEKRYVEEQIVEKESPSNYVEAKPIVEEAFEHKANKHLIVELKQLNTEYTQINDKLKLDFKNLEKINKDLKIANTTLKDKLQLFYICMIVITVLQTLLVSCFALR